MFSYICLLRGINVSGKRKVQMTELKRLFESLGFSQVHTYIQSGNVVFECQNPNVKSLQIQITDAIAPQFGFEVPTIILTCDELNRCIDNTPFGGYDINVLHVTFLSDIPTNYSLETLNKAKDIKEDFVIIDKAIYLYCPNGYGRTKLTNTFFEKKLGVLATTRNWKTVLALAELSQTIPAPRMF